MMAQIVIVIERHIPAENLGENTSFVSQAIVRAAEAFSPKPKNSHRRHTVPYWNDDCRIAIKDLHPQERSRDFKKQVQLVTLVWILAHLGIPGNEKADTMAKLAKTRGQIDCQIPASIKIRQKIRRLED